MKNLLVLGGTSASVGLIEEAHEMCGGGGTCYCSRR